jgi:serine/threonine protein kinase
MGGMGAVYLGEHTLIGRKAAIKVLLPEFSRKQDICDRFFNEARAGTAIGHPGIVQIFDFGYHKDGSAYLVMELLLGEALNDRLDRLRRLGEDDVLRITRQCASALAAAHAAGIVHRDLKPANIFLSSDPEMEAGERVKILDFGIAKLTDSSAAGDLRTRTGSMMGTPAYMSPEQCRGAGLVDHRSDIYSLGCVMFRMLCGRPPFLADGVGEIIASHLREPSPSPRTFEPAISPALEAVVQRTLAKQPEARFASMEELASVLQSLRHGGAARPGTAYQRPGSSSAPPAAAPPAPPPAMQPPEPAPFTAFPTYRPGSHSDVVATSGHTGHPPPRGAMPDPGTLAPVASQRLQAAPRRSRRGLVIASGIVAVGAAVALLVALAGDDEPAVLALAPATGTEAGEPTAERAAPTPAQGSAAVADAPAADTGAQAAEQPAELGQTSGETAPADAPPVPAGPATALAPPAAGEPTASPVLAVQIESTPAGAAIYEPGRDRKLGVTPFRYERPADDAEAVTLSLQLKGYESEQVEIPAGSTKSIAVKLRRSPDRGLERRGERTSPDGKSVRKIRPKPPIDDDPLRKM